MSLARATRVGERCVLYRARTRRGFVGVFEITGSAVNEPTRVGSKVFATKVPWRPLLLSEDHPVELAKLAPMLSFIVNKRQPGAYLQTNFKTTFARGLHDH